MDSSLNTLARPKFYDAQKSLNSLANILLNRNCWNQYDFITFHLWSHAKRNSFYSIGCRLNYSKFSDHLEVVGLMHEQYQNIL